MASLNQLFQKQGIIKWLLGSLLTLILSTVGFLGFLDGRIDDAAYSKEAGMALEKRVEAQDAHLQNIQAQNERILLMLGEMRGLMEKKR